jgi:hypothetical protein
MIEYRAYLVDNNGHMSNYRAFKSVNDAEAAVWAKQLVDDHDVELWSGSRFVVRLEHEKT